MTVDTTLRRTSFVGGERDFPTARRKEEEMGHLGITWTSGELRPVTSPSDHTGTQLVFQETVGAL